MSGNAQYSCQCGWLDWSHITPSQGYAILDNLKKAYNRTLADTGGQWGISTEFRLAKGFVDITTFFGLAVIPDSVAMQLSTEASLLRLGISIYMDGKEGEERGQGRLGVIAMLGEWAILGGTDEEALALYRSYFSEEDLTSDLVGFYIGKENFFGRGTVDQLKENVRSICQAFDQQNSFQIWKEVYERSIYNVARGWKNWYPRLLQLHCQNSSEYQQISSCLGQNRQFPHEFSSLTSYRIHPNKNGTWWWTNTSWLTSPTSIPNFIKVEDGFERGFDLYRSGAIAA